MLHGHGNHTLGMENKIKVDFSSNVWYEPLNEQLISHLKASLDKISNYPPVDAANLQHKVAAYQGIEPGNVCITSGATEAFYLIAHAFSASSSLIFAPAFSEYEDAAKLYKHKVTNFLGIDNLHETKLTSKLVWIGNPNNPDGKVLSVETIEGLLKDNPDSIFVVDEAYGALCFGFESALSLISSYNNLIVVKSVTKLCSIPGLRLGYFMACEELVEKISALRMPWSVATLALEAGMYIFDHYQEFKLDVRQIKEECTSFQHKIAAIDKIEVIPSCTNYFLAKLHTATAQELKNFLINQYGFLIRDCSNFRGLSQHHFRLAVQGKDNNEACSKAISEFIQQ